VVTADDRTIRAADDEHPDLFWALRGGGGNFGVVTEFEFRLHPVGPIVQLGMFCWGLGQGHEALRLAREVVAALPERMGAQIAALNAPPASFVPQEYQFAPVLGLIVVGFGAESDHARIVDAIRTAQPPLFDLVTAMPYTALQQILDQSAPPGIFAYEKAVYLPGLSDAVIDVSMQRLPAKASPQSVVPISPLTGAFTRVPEDATAFGGPRDAVLAFNVTALAPNQELLNADRAWAREFWEALRPHALNSGSYVNFMTEFDDDRVRATFGGKHAQLAAVKATYDPDNIFHHNPNIRPRAATA